MLPRRLDASTTVTVHGTRYTHHQHHICVTIIDGASSFPLIRPLRYGYQLEPEPRRTMLAGINLNPLPHQTMYVNVSWPLQFRRLRRGNGSHAFCCQVSILGSSIFVSFSLFQPCQCASLCPPRLFPSPMSSSPPSPTPLQPLRLDGMNDLQEAHFSLTYDSRFHARPRPSMFLLFTAAVAAFLLLSQRPVLLQTVEPVVFAPSCIRKTLP